MRERNIEPLGNRVLLRRVEAAAVSEGGIVIAEIARDKLSRGIVLDFGGEVVSSLGRGDEVAFSEFAAITIKVDNQEYLVIEDKDLLATIGPAPSEDSDG